MISSFRIRLNKTQYLLIISIFLSALGLVPKTILTLNLDLIHPYSIHTISLKTDDGIRISAFEYQPLEERKESAIVLSHHYLGNKLRMHSLAIELVRRGFTVISIDFRGHGASGGSFIWDGLSHDIDAAVEYIKLNKTYIKSIGLIGHSLGAIKSLEFSKDFTTRINATVAIGGLINNVSTIKNLLLIKGLGGSFEENQLLTLVRSYSGDDNATLGELYDGDFFNGKNIKALITQSSVHLLEILDPIIMHETILWMEKALNKQSPLDIVLTQWLIDIFIIIYQSGIVLLFFALIAFLFNFLNNKSQEYPEKVPSFKKYKKLGGHLITYYSFLVMGVNMLFMIIFSSPFSPYIFSSLLYFFFLEFIGIGIFTFFLHQLFLMNIETHLSLKSYIAKITKFCSTNSKLSILIGISTSILSILFFNFFFAISKMTTSFSFSDFFSIILTVPIVFPFILVKELYFRSIHDLLKGKYLLTDYLQMVIAGIFMDSFFFSLIFLGSYFGILYIIFDIIYLKIWIIVSILLNLISTYIYLFTRNILGTTLFLSISYFWLTVFVFPLYGFQ